MKPLLTALVLFLNTVVLPARAETECGTYAFALEPMRSIELRAGAGEQFDLIATVPADEGRTLFGIVGVEHRPLDIHWLKIDRVVDSRGQTVFSGTGWVPAIQLAVKSHPRYTVFVEPSVRAEPVDISLFDAVLPLADCRGEWVQVELPVTGTEIVDPQLRGWMPAGAYCANPWVECD
jgi:hypothetical protein